MACVDCSMHGGQLAQWCCFPSSLGLRKGGGPALVCYRTANASTHPARQSLDPSRAKLPGSSAYVGPRPSGSFNLSATSYLLYYLFTGNPTSTYLPNPLRGPCPPGPSHTHLRLPYRQPGAAGGAAAAGVSVNACALGLATDTNNTPRAMLERPTATHGKVMDPLYITFLLPQG